MNRQLQILALVACLLLAAAVSAHDYVPGEPQDHPILLKGGDLYTVANGVMEGTDLLFEDGRITQIGTDLALPEGTEVIDISGKHVYPGLIDLNTQLGLIEIGAVRATNDITERGRTTPEVKAYIAYNPDSELLPSVRSNGITTALVVPGGSLIRGRSSLMNLDGWTWEDAAEKPIAALHISWPRTRVITAWWMDQSAEEQKEQMAKNRRELVDMFDKAHAYYIAKQADPDLPKDIRWEAMAPIFTGDLPVFIEANDYRQIEQAIAFADKWKLNVVITGAREAWRAADMLAEHDIPVIVSRTQNMPLRSDDDYDIAFKQPALLQQAGVRFAISASSSWGTRNLPWHTGMAVAFGLTPEMALRSITLTPAEIIGVADDIGSLEVGKKATLFVSEGDVLDYLGHGVELMFIGGAAVDLSNKHKELYEKYRQKEYPVEAAE